MKFIRPTIHSKYFGIRTMENLYTIKEVAEILKVSERTIRRILIDNEIPIYRIGRQIRISESTLQLLLTFEKK